MCRMIGAIWTTSSGAEFVARLVRLVYEAASSDPLLASIAGDSRHCHGYGYMVIYSSGHGFRAVVEKYDAADELGIGEESCKANLEALEEASHRLAEIVESSLKGIVLFHARRAGRREPRGTMHTHPFIHGLGARHGYRTIALIHNGSVDKEQLAMMMGVDPEAYTDSHVLTLWLSRQLGYGRVIEEVLKEAQRFTRTALDIVVADVVSAQKPKMLLYAYSHLAKGLDTNRLVYYKPVFFKTSDSQGYVSSTIKMLAEKQGLSLGETVEEPGYILKAELK